MKKHLNDIIAIGSGVLVTSLLVWWVIANSPSKDVKRVMTSTVALELPSFSNTFKSNKLQKEAGPAIGDGAIISRPIKGLGGYKHYGVYIDGKIAHFNQYGFHLDSLDDFAEGSVVKVIKHSLKGKDREEFRARLKKMIKKYKHSNYDAINNNCEHFVNEAVYNAKISMQSDLTKDMLESYAPEIKEELKKNNLGLLIPAFDNLVNKALKDSSNLKK